MSIYIKKLSIKKLDIKKLDIKKLTKIDAIKRLVPGFSNVQAYTLDNPAIVSNQSVKPKRKLLVALGDEPADSGSW